MSIIMLVGQLIILDIPGKGDVSAPTFRQRLQSVKMNFGRVPRNTQSNRRCTPFRDSHHLGCMH